MDFTELEGLAAEWRDYIEKHPAPDDMSRASGYRSGLRVAAQQLEDTLARLRADQEAGL
jgi:hypothetical protein